jgi:hypothetical protein
MWPVCLRQAEAISIYPIFTPALKDGEILFRVIEYLVGHYYNII